LGVDQLAQFPQRSQTDAGAIFVSKLRAGLLVHHPCRQTAMRAVRQDHHDSGRPTGRETP
jgi:hypothetical protein